MTGEERALQGEREVASATLSSSMGDASNYTRWIMDWFRPYMGERLVEIGLGCGNYSEFFPPLSDYLGLDIDPDIIGGLRAAQPERDYVCMDLADPTFVTAVGRKRFDTAICVNVLEHISDHRVALENLRDVVAPDGHLLLFVPAFSWLYTDLDKLAGHVRRYTIAEVRALIESVGVEVVRLEYFNPVGAVGWWVQKCVAHQDLEAGKVTSQVRVFDKYVLPASRVANVLTKSFFGQSIIGVARIARR